jgi:flagellar biosynthesis/type III secretory pathway protein FliH
VQIGSTDAIEAKSLSLEQRESMMPRTSAPPPDLLGARGPESADFSAMQAIYQAKLEESLTVFERGVEELINARAGILEASEHTIVRLAAAIARRVIGREVMIDPDLMLTLAAEGAEALGERDRVVVRFAPFEREDLWQALEERVRRRIPRCQVIQDPTLSAGQCIVQSELGQVDESVDQRLATVLEAILPQSSHFDD